MNILNNIRVALRALLANKLRSGLTILGIVIGVAAVVALLAIGRGATSNITEQVENMGTNLVTISSGQSFRPGQGGGFSSTALLYKDYETVIEEMNKVGAISPYYSSMSQVAVSDRTSDYSVIGVLPIYLQVNNLSVASGRFITNSDNTSKSKVVVIGASVSEDLFEGLNPIGRSIKINNVSFEIIGVLESKGTSGFMSGDSSVLIPLQTGYSRVFGSRAISNGQYTLSGISISVIDPEGIDSTITNSELILRSQHKLGLYDDLPFSVSSQEQMLESLSAVSATMSIYLGAIAGISLLVGGIGIMNITLVSVTERTREIGLRKAVGAPQKAILLQFLVETMTLALIGGLLGVALGAGIAWVFTTLGLITAKVTFDVVFIAFISSALIGLFFGIYPAFQASKLKPIEALRYE
jgi:putative ABC transport system permease protein